MQICHSLTHSLTQVYTLLVISWPERERPSPTPCWNSNRARHHIGIVTVQSVQAYYSMHASCHPEYWWFCSFTWPLILQCSCFAKLKWSWLQMFKLVLWPTWKLNFRNIWVVQAFKMTRRCAFVCWKVTYKANVVSFDENVSYSSTSINLYERNKQLLMNETAIEWKTNISTIVYCNFIFII